MLREAAQPGPPGKCGFPKIAPAAKTLSTQSGNPVGSISHTYRDYATPATSTATPQGRPAVSAAWTMAVAPSLVSLLLSSPHYAPNYRSERDKPLFKPCNVPILFTVKPKALKMVSGPYLIYVYKTCHLSKLASFYTPLAHYIQPHWLPCRHTVASGPLHWLFPLPGMLFPQMLAWLTPHLLQVFAQMSPSQPVLP